MFSIQSVFACLVSISALSFVILAIGALAARMTRQPVERIRVIQLTLLATALAVGLGQLPVLPKWHLGLFDGSDGRRPTATADAESSTAERTAAEAGALPPRGPGEAIAGADSAAADSAPVETARQGPPANAVQPLGPTSGSSKPANSADAQTAGTGLGGGFRLVLVIAFAAAMLLSFGEWLFGVLWLRENARRCIEAPSWLRKQFTAIAGPGGSAVRLLVSDRVQTPLAYGWLRPVILFPRRMLEGTSDADRRYCLAHEWSHIRRGDIAIWRLANLCQLLLWCQPMFWVLRRELRVCQDYLADLEASQHGSRASEYAELLLSLATYRMSVPAGAALGVCERRSNLYRRIEMLVEGTIRLRTDCRLGVTIASLALFAAVSLGAAFVGFGAASAADRPAEDSKSASDREAAGNAEASEKQSLSYSGVVLDKQTGKGIEGAEVTVRRMVLKSYERRVIEETKHATDSEGRYTFVIPPDQVAERFLCIELDVRHGDYATKAGFGYALSMIRKNEKLGERPFFEKVELWPAEQITGKLVSPDGKPVGGVKLLAYSKGESEDREEYGSFYRAQSKDDGTFRLNVIKGGRTLFWIVPQDFVPQQHVMGIKRGDLGEVKLQRGTRISGQVLDAEGSPVPGVWVNLADEHSQREIKMPVASAMCRAALTDEQGQFKMAPMAPGQYTVAVEEYPHDINVDYRRVTPKSLPAVFISKKITIEAGAEPEPVRLEAVPHVVIRGQYYDSKGKPCRGHAISVFGRIRGRPFHTQGRPDKNGRIVCMAPRGLENAQMDLMTNEHGALRYRLSPDEKLRPEPVRIILGTLREDIEHLEIVRYTAPIVLVKAVDDDNQPVEGFKVSADYAWTKQLEHGTRYVLGDGVTSDVNFEKQEDGRYRSSQLLPDEEVTITATADGYEPASRKLNLREGETEELTLVLKKQR